MAKSTRTIKDYYTGDCTNISFVPPITAKLELRIEAVNGEAIAGELMLTGNLDGGSNFRGTLKENTIQFTTAGESQGFEITWVGIISDETILGSYLVKHHSKASNGHPQAERGTWQVTAVESRHNGLPDYYGILNLTPEADIQAIKHAYRACALKFHPDKGGSHEQMLKINEAFEILANPETRRNYDNARKHAADDNSRKAASKDGAQARKTAGEYPRNWSDFESWMDRLTKDFTNVKYGEFNEGGICVPTAPNSVSGKVFIIAGGAAGFFIAAALFAESVKGSSGAMRGIGLAGIAVGAFVGKLVHQAIGDSLKKPQTEKPGGSSPSPGVSQPDPPARIDPIVTECPHCSQKLRIHAFTVWPKLKCNACRHEFEFSPAAAYSAGMKLWKAGPAVRHQAIYWIRSAGKAGCQEAVTMAKMQGFNI